MNAQPPQDTPEPWGWTRRQRLGLGILLTLLVMVLTIQWARRPARLDQPATVIHGAPTYLPQLLDPNTAAQNELARIPHIGDVLAQRIIQYREARKAAVPDGIVFRQLQDLDAVQGIGPKLLEQMTPFFRFPEAPATQGL
jgi:competence protein ComEA